MSTDEHWPQPRHPAYQQTELARQDECDLAIVGAGIIGLITAYRLRQLRPDWRIQIFEKGSSPGGRMVSKRPDPAGPVMEFGAGRFHPDNHPNVMRLLAEFQIDTQPFNYPCGEMRSQGELSQAVYDSCQRLLKLSDTLSSEERATRSFLEAAALCMSRDEVDHLICAIGYDSLYHPGFSLEHGLHVLLYHPETPFRSNNGSNKWRSPAPGFQCLAQTIASQLMNQCAFSYQHRLVSTQQLAAEGSFRLDFETETGQRQISTHRVVCATSLRDLATIKHPCRSECMQLGHLVDVPLTKGYICHSAAWWHDTPLSGRCVTTHLPFRKLYFPTSGSAYLFYSDGPSAMKLEAMLTAGTAVPELIAEIASSIPLNEEQHRQLAEYDCQWKFWPSGIVFWEEKTELQRAYISEQAPNFILCSDAFTPELGWIEGSLLSADAAVARLTAPTAAG